MNTRGAKPRTTDQQDPLGKELLRLARCSIEHGLIYRQPAPVNLDELPKAVRQPGATFTSVHCEGELRGCRGTLEAARPLAEDVTRTAFQAAFHDPRFTPVGEHELAAVSLEISVLSPPERMTVADEEGLLAQLRPGTDGLFIMAPGRRATFLPKVWERVPDPRQFLIAHVVQTNAYQGARPCYGSNTRPRSARGQIPGN